MHYSCLVLLFKGACSNFPCRLREWASTKYSKKNWFILVFQATTLVVFSFFLTAFAKYRNSSPPPFPWWSLVYFRWSWFTLGGLWFTQIYLDGGHGLFFLHCVCSGFILFFSCEDFVLFFSFVVVVLRDRAEYLKRKETRHRHRLPLCGLSPNEWHVCVKYIFMSLILKILMSIKIYLPCRW